MTDDPLPAPPDGQSLVTSITMLVIGAGRVAQRRLEAALREHGLTLRHLGALGHLARWTPRCCGPPCWSSPGHVGPDRRRHPSPCHAVDVPSSVGS